MVAVIAVMIAAVTAGCAGAATAQSRRCAAARGFAPWDDGAGAAAGDGRIAGGDDESGAADGLIAIYQRYLRAPTLPGAGCRFHPSCSVYARQAVRRYGVLGLVLAFDRLILRAHGFSDDAYLSDCVQGRPRRHDPIP